jgi:iron complex transport system substrate-binding protein
VRIASLQPSVTLTLAALGRLDALCAHTKYCIDAMPSLAELKLPIVADSWSTTTTELDAIRPDLVIASVPYRLESLAAILKAGLPVLALAPHTLEDVLQDTLLIARQVDRVQEAETLIEDFRRALADAKDAAIGLKKRRVYCEEWGKPLIHSQRWIAELIESCGGIFLGTPGAQTTPEIVAEADPDLLIFAWCGAGDRVPLERVVIQRGWRDLRAVRDREVYCIPDEYLNTPAIPSLRQGLIHLGAAICPERFVSADRLISLKR